MSKFKVGDRVRIVKDLDSDGNHYGVMDGLEGTVVSVGEGSYDYHLDVYEHGSIRCEHYSAMEEGLELIKSSKGDKKVTEPKKHLYRLKKDTLEHKAVTVFIEQCTDGTQDFNLFSPTTHVEGTCVASIKRGLVVDNPTWFEEVKMEYVPVVKRGRKPGVKKTAKVSTWTPERRAAQSRRMKRIRAARKDTWGK